MRVAARLAYWGPAYHGYARQPSVDTVEGDLVQALLHVRAIRDPRSARLAVASRTDRGVSAVANVVAFDSFRSPAVLLRAVSGRMHHAWLWSCVPAEDTFNPRQARKRTYRYHFPRDVSVPRLREAARILQGHHDFASFTVERLRTTLTIDRIRVRRDPSFVLADFEAARFARGLVRRLAAAMEAYAREERSGALLRRAVAGDPFPVRPASPDGLFLLDVDCGFRWPHTSALVEASIRDRLRAVTLAHRFVEGLLARIPGDGSEAQIP